MRPITVFAFASGLALVPLTDHARAQVAPATSFVVLATPHGLDVRDSEVRRVSITAAGAIESKTVGSVHHAPFAVLRGDARGATVFVVADEDGARGDFGAALLAVDGAGTRKLVGGVGHARRPLASADGLVYVERGEPGAPPSDARSLRVDTLHLDAVDPSSGASRVVCTYSGYALHLAGERAGSLLVYRVGPGGADVAAVDRASGAVTSLSSVEPFARDFGVDESSGALVFAGRSQDAWTVERLDLTTRALTELSRDAEQQSSPLALAGSIAQTAPRRTGLSLAGKRVAPLGDGFDAPRMATDDGRFLLSRHVPRDGDGELYVLDTKSGAVSRLGATEHLEPVRFDAQKQGGAR